MWQRISWISSFCQTHFYLHRLLISDLNTSTSQTRAPLLESKSGDICFKSTNFPALWGFATYGFDQKTSIMTAGNMFGELALCDYVGERLRFRQSAWMIHLYLRPLIWYYPPSVFGKYRRPFLVIRLKCFGSPMYRAKICREWLEPKSGQIAHPEQPTTSPNIPVRNTEMARFISVHCWEARPCVSFPRSARTSDARGWRRLWASRIGRTFATSWLQLCGADCKRAVQILDLPSGSGSSLTSAGFRF